MHVYMIYRRNIIPWTYIIVKIICILITNLQNKEFEEDKCIGEKNTSGNGENPEGSNRENMGKALMQLYGMGQGMNSFPSGVTQANPFLHPTMFSATGK